MSVSSPGGSQPGPGYRPAVPIRLEYGIYRDGDNNLDAAEGPVIPQAIAVSKANPDLQMTVEDTTELNGNGLKTYDFILQNGVADAIHRSAPVEMSQRQVLASFVARTLDNAERAGAPQTWLELVNHGAGDAGGLFTVLDDQSIAHMSVDDLAWAIATGQALHAQRHPEDANRVITGVVMHECFELTTAVAESLSRVGVRYLAASPETTIAPGIPSTVAADIATYMANPQAMGTAMVTDVLSTRYREKNLVYGPTAAFDVVDLAPAKMEAIAETEKAFNDTAIAVMHKDPGIRKRILHDARKVPGMQRDDPDEVVPWRADRPAIALYMHFVVDPQLPLVLRQAALNAARAQAAAVVSHGETFGAVGFGKDYRDAAGLTTRMPTKYAQIDPLSPEISETACNYAYASDRNALIANLLLQSQSRANNGS